MIHTTDSFEQRVTYIGSGVSECLFGSEKYFLGPGSVCLIFDLLDVALLIEDPEGGKGGYIFHMV